ncbi:MAG: ImmA/IrrE family metallo-endopeptidase [Chloroflexia bacterium]|nr:ImmA/IrrE family metallo-endopeptidase [Chloroflexia bacterium]
MDAGHELGHVVIHGHRPPPTSDKDPRRKVMEQQAFQFAGAFLLPAQSFESDFWSRTLEEPLALKPKWRVAVAAIIMLASHLGLISDRKQLRLWKRAEPFDDEWSPERPVLLRRSFELMLEAKVVSVDRILNHVKLLATYIEDLAGLPRERISDDPAPISFRERELAFVRHHKLALPRFR